MATRTKAQRSASAKKATLTRKRNALTNVLDKKYVLVVTSHSKTSTKNILKI